MRIVTFGDQLIATPKSMSELNPDKHWWQLLAKDLDCEAIQLSYDSKQHSISPLYYCSRLLKEVIAPDDFFIGILPSSNRSTEFVGTKIKHNVSVDRGPHLNEHYQVWQREIAIRMLELWSKHNNCFFFIMETTPEQHDPGSKKFYVIPEVDPRERFDMNHLWKWVMLEHPELSHPGHFYQKCAPERTLNAYGHKCVYDVLKKHLNNVLDFDNKKII